MDPAVMRARARGLRDLAGWHEGQARRRHREAEELEEQAALDEATPPTVEERIDRVLAGNPTPLVRRLCLVCGLVANVDPALHEERYGHAPVWEATNS